MLSAIVHDWLVHAADGAGRCLQSIHELYPSPIYTLIQDPSQLQGTYFADKQIISSFIQHLPFAAKSFRNYLPLFPLAIERFDLSGYDLILSSSHCVAKGVLSHPHQLHICYCHTPMRYGWDLMHSYVQQKNCYGKIKRWAAELALHRLRLWDVISSHRVDHFVANSQYVARRIRKIYRQDAHVIYPPVDTSFFSLHQKKEQYYLTASRMVPYKKLDVIVEAFASMPDKRLLVIGSGPEEKRLKQKATQNIEFLGFQTDEQLRFYLQRAKGFVFAALEDFGILPVEAMASGTPVIGLRGGGVQETIQESVSGLFFEDQSAFSICRAIEQFERHEFDPFAVRRQAEKFSKERFQLEFHQFVTERYRDFTCT